MESNPTVNHAFTRNGIPTKSHYQTQRVNCNLYHFMWTKIKL